MTSPGQQRTNGGGVPDIRTMLAASADDDGAPLPGMLARAMVYSQDADRKLDRARAMKQEAAKYRDEAQRQTVEQTEASAPRPAARRRRSTTPPTSCAPRPTPTTAGRPKRRPSRTP